jgi:cysteine desulfurase family protein
VPRIYLDNAATSWPKPEAVYTAVHRYLRENGAPAGRSAYRQATEVEGIIASARTAVARLIGAADGRQIIFTSNGTDALNLAIHGLLHSGDHAICTAADHNSVLRPLRHLKERGQIEVTRVPCNTVGWVDPDDVRRALRSNTRLVAMTHVSNVTGTIEPVAEVGQIVRQHGARFLVDAAQSLGHLPMDAEKLHADLLAAPAHKGLLGPLGTGLLYIRPKVESELQSVRQGGTGTRSDEDRQPDSLPDKFESGNHNVPGLVGLAAALQWLDGFAEPLPLAGEGRATGIAAIYNHEQQLAARLASGFQQIPGVTLHGPQKKATEATNPAVGTPATLGVVSISIEGYDPQEAAAALDANFGVQVRAGLHCAPLIHKAMGTIQRGGTVRFSIGAFNTEEQIDAAIAAVEKIAKAV